MNVVQARMKKKSKSRRTTKSKKLRHRHDSESSSSDYDSQSMSSASLSSSGDEYQRRKRFRTPARSSTKGLDKKKSRRYSYSSDSSEDQTPRKKRKGSRNDDDLGAKKKRDKKKLKHQARKSVSLSSTDFSTCEESEFERHRTRDRDERKAWDAGRISSKRSRHDSRSCSPCSKNSLDEADHDEKMAVGNIPVRLKSVIVIINGRYERNMELDEQPPKEIVYDRNEDPSCRNDDSNHGGSKKELATDSKVESKMEGLGTLSRGFEANSADDGDERNPCSDVFLEAVSNKELQKVADTSGNGDLESILRQRALENLKRLKGGVRNKGKEVSSITRENNGEVKQSAATSADASQNTLPKTDDSAKAANAEGLNAHSVRRNPTNIALVEDKSGGKEGGSPMPPAVKAVRQITGPGIFNQRLVSTQSAGTFNVNSPRVNPFTWRRDSSVPKPVPKESQIPQSKPLVANVPINKSSVKVSESVLSANKSGNDAGANQPSASKTPSLVGEAASVKMKALKNEAKDGPRRIVASTEPDHSQASEVSVYKVAESESSANKPSDDTGATQPCVSASNDPSSRGLREMSSVKVEAKFVPGRTVILKKSHPHANLMVNKSVSKEGSGKLSESCNKASTDAGANNQSCGSASEYPSSSGVVEEAPGGEAKSEAAAKDGTQYEQKTMTVVRGGEMMKVRKKWWTSVIDQIMSKVANAILFCLDR